MGGGKSSLGQGIQQLGNNFEAGGKALGNNFQAGLHELGANAQGGLDQFKNNTKDFSWDPSHGTLGAIAQGFGNGGNFSKADSQIGSGLGQIAKGGLEATNDILDPVGAAAMGSFNNGAGARTAANEAKVQGQENQAAANNTAAQQANAAQQQQQLLASEQQANQAGFNQANSFEDALRAAALQRSGQTANANGF